jgi:5-methylcytosine-specific restriction enzyme subunit McrC
MRMSSSNPNNHYVTREYDGFTRNIYSEKYQNLPVITFDALENFILANMSGTGTEATELLSLSVRRGIGKVITARNHVGLIAMKDGTIIEILPKITGDGIDDKEIRQIFFKMLKTLKNIPFKDFNVSNLNIDRMNILDIFIKMFLDEISVLTKQGLKSTYTQIESNERFFKGKLLTSQNIKYNLVNRERFFVRYDDFTLNRAENRLIKSTLHFLLKLTTDDHNRRDAIHLLTFFENVDYSADYKTDFSKCVSDRDTSHYDKALSWCHVFLCGNSFTAYAGSEVALALLFPMEKVFESYVATMFRKNKDPNTTLRTQDTLHYLFDTPRSFALRPDIVIESEDRPIIMDTKWKLLSDGVRNGISQSDMYQMYAYGKKYDAKKVVLLYPNSDVVIQPYEYRSEGDVGVSIKFIDLRNTEKDYFRDLLKDIITI